MRHSPQIRELAATVSLSHREFIQPLFAEEGLREAKPLKHLPGIYSEGEISLLRRIETDLRSGINKFLLFPVVHTKAMLDFNFGYAVSVVEKIKKEFGQDAWLATDVCLCGYTSHGHCGVLNAEGSHLNNDESVKILARYSWLLAQAGADCIAPSDMLDGRIAAIRSVLDQHALDHVTLMSYSSKFSSQWYGPFREACHSSPAGKSAIRDRKSYQLSPANPEDAVQCALRDEQEGADILMVKPATLYTDIIARVRDVTKIPLAAYHVSGEYAAIELMAREGLLQREAAHLEVWTALKRAGADIIISYAARESKQWINQVQL
jgi:porphobilinogen synthase